MDEEYQLVKHELRQEIQRHMWRKGWKKADLASAASIYPSDLSNFMNGNGTRTFPLEALDAITEALGLEPGYFYPLYFGECYNKGKLIRHRCEEFLYRCALLRKDEFVQRLIDALLSESKSHLQTIFAVAKRLFDEKHPSEALPLVDAVIENDHNRFSERLATCYFYRFYIVRNHGMEQGNHALVKMLEYLAYMPAEIQMEAYLRIITFYYAREEWNMVWIYARKLEAIASDEKYLGESLLYQCFALREWGRYEDALRLTDRYAKINPYYADLAVGNRYFILVRSGRLEFINDLIDRLKERSQVHIGLPVILEACIQEKKYDQAYHYLLEHQSEIEKLEHSPVPHTSKFLLRIYYLHGLICFQKGETRTGIEKIIHAATLAESLGNHDRLKDCMRLLWNYHEYISDVQVAKIRQIMSRGD